MWWLSSIIVASLVPGGRNIPPKPITPAVVERFYAGDRNDINCRLQMMDNATFTYAISDCFGAICRATGRYVRTGSQLVLYSRCPSCCTARRLRRVHPAVGQQTYIQRLCLLASRVRRLKSRISRSRSTPPLCRTGVPRTLSRVQWGRRLYLVTVHERSRFRRAIRVAEEPRSMSAGNFLLRVGDEKVRTPPGSVPIF